jgi:hypothetical protein
MVNKFNNKKVGGFLGIPSFGVKDKLKGIYTKDQENKPLVQTPSSTPSSTPTSSISSNDQKMYDDNREKCILAADIKMKEAIDDKKRCEASNPKKKMFFGLFGGKRKSINKKKSHKKRKNKRSTKKTTR